MGRGNQGTFLSKTTAGSWERKEVRGGCFRQEAPSIQKSRNRLFEHG